MSNKQLKLNQSLTIGNIIFCQFMDLKDALRKEIAGGLRAFNVEEVEEVEDPEARALLKSLEEAAERITEGAERLSAALDELGDIDLSKF